MFASSLTSVKHRTRTVIVRVYFEVVRVLFLGGETCSDSDSAAFGIVEIVATIVRGSKLTEFLSLRNSVDPLCNVRRRNLSVLSE